jgi:hypothetical protein
MKSSKIVDKEIIIELITTQILVLVTGDRQMGS